MIINILCSLFIILFVFLSLTIKWMLATWQHLTIEELIYHLNTSLEGTNKDLIRQFLIEVLLPTVLIYLVIVGISVLVKRFTKLNRLRSIFAVTVCTAAIICVGMITKAMEQLDVETYLRLQSETSDFIGTYYVAPDDVDIIFPEEKRNLIFIFLESMETTYADIDLGGAFEESCIPELTSLAIQGEDFSGSEEAINGGHVMSNASWTIAGMFAQSSGLPLKTQTGNDSMEGRETFFSQIVCLGDILEEAGYQNMLMVGSDATFGGRELYYTEHGNYIISDYMTAVEEQRIDPHYKFGQWGYEDAKLFAYAKEEITALAETDEPFNFTMLTVDTHFEDGTVCQLCGDEFGDNQYANVYACSSKQVNEFITWLQEQPFYENTTVVISGDHLTMDSDFCNGIAEDYERKTYTCILNAAAEVEYPEKRREYTTFDIFPTTLAAMGVEIEGNRLALGTNLFSGESTLLELMDYQTLDEEMRKNSSFMIEQENLEEDLEMAECPSGEYSVELNSEDNKLLIYLSELDGKSHTLGKLYAVVKSAETQYEVEFAELENGEYCAVLDVGQLAGADISIEYYWQDIAGEAYHMDTVTRSLAWMQLATVSEYMEALCDTQYSILLAVQGEVESKLTEGMIEYLKQLGLSTDWCYIDNMSYYAVINNDTIIEEYGTGMIYYEGRLSGVPYQVISCGGETDFCNIALDARIHAIGETGINIVVYDAVSKKVVDSVCLKGDLSSEIIRHG
ncbi:MAG: LTA synthase family protein [Lachnospiraceae bacterium]|nr:LTA synthase family protein [Lachnospiraceae bacterium]